MRSPRGAGLLAAALCAGFWPTPSPVSAASLPVAVIGSPCSGAVRSAVDDARRLLSCSSTTSGKRWIWASVVPSPVPADAALPPTWTDIVADISGNNADSPVPALPGASVNRGVMELRIVELANQQRVVRGLAPLTVDWRLTHLARWWAQHHTDAVYAGRGTTHCPSTLCGVRAAELGYLSFGEVIRPWSPFPMGDLANERYFVDSARHLAILVQPRVTHIGFGVHITTGPNGVPASVSVVGMVGRSKA